MLELVHIIKKNTLSSRVLLSSLSYTSTIQQNTPIVKINISKLTGREKCQIFPPTLDSVAGQHVSYYHFHFSFTVISHAFHRSKHDFSRQQNKGKGTQPFTSQAGLLISQSAVVKTKVSICKGFHQPEHGGQRRIRSWRMLLL